MIDGSEKRSFELQNSCDFEKCRDLISLVCFVGWLHVELHAGHTKTTTSQSNRENREHQKYFWNVITASKRKANQA